jgi:formylglycine-generating enzyme required for sulfatase activity
MTQEEFFKRYKYSIRTDKVGGGAFGTVYKAFDEVLNREVAIKVSEVKIMGGKEFSLKDEFDAIKDVPVQRNIANYESLHTFESPQGIFDYAVMQFYKDGNLSSFIKGNPTLAQKEQVALDLLEGIHHLHKHSVVHRDLKPGNILIVKRGDKTIPVITDFGLSKNAKTEGQSRFSNSFGGGTLKYSSPEQLKAEKLRLNTDLWAYGVIVYEVFTGKNLFMAQQITGASAEAEKEIYEQIIGVDVSEMIKELPGKWQEVVKQCLVRDGAKRIKSTQALKDLILKGEMNTDSAASINDDKTLISEVVSEESMNAQTIVHDKQTIKKKAVKEESVNRESVKKDKPKKEQPKQDKSFQSQQSFTESKKVENKKRPLIIVGVIIGLLVISGFVYAMLPNESNDWETVKITNNIKGFQEYVKKYPEGEHVNDAKEYMLWLSVKDDEIIDSVEVYLNEFPNGKFTSVATDCRAWLKAKELNTRISYDSYLKTYPEGIYASKSKTELERIVLDSVLKIHTNEALNYFKRILPSSKFLVDIDIELEKNKKELEKKLEEKRNIISSMEKNMLNIKGGVFNMGCPGREDRQCRTDESPVHSINIDSYKIGKFEITQTQWKEVMGKNPSENRKCKECPVNNVSWNDIQIFLKKLNKLTGKSYRLPTEVQWEYAARGGVKSKGYKYAGSNNYSIVGYSGYYGDERDTTRPVGKKKPNELGIYDMSGNAYEWCHDYYDKNYYSSSAKNNPKGPKTGKRRVLRDGGFWSECISNRRSDLPNKKSKLLGFRLAL